MELPSLPIGSKAGSYDRGLIIEYALTPLPLILPFLFNPSTITRTRSVNVKTGGTPGARGGYGFSSPTETSRASQGVSVNAESLSFKILLDATDRMDEGDTAATYYGVQPEVDVIHSMLEPKSVGGAGLNDLNIVAGKSLPAFSTHEVSSVLIFKWGTSMLPVFLTQAQIEGQEFLPSGLYPYRAEVSLTLQVIETDNPIYKFEKLRQQVSARGFANLLGPQKELIKF